MALYRVRSRVVSCWKSLCILALLFLFSENAFAEVRPVAWGNGSSGQLGRGSLSHSSVPVPVSLSGALSGKTIVALSGGFNHSLALDSEGKVYAWGLNSHGQLGNGVTTNSSLPVAVSTNYGLSAKTVSAIAAGVEHSVALASDGTIYAWGRNDWGQLGNGSTQSYTPLSVPVSMSGALAGKTITAIAAGNHHNLALASDGTVFGWGNNINGELGNGSTSFQRTPVPVSTSGTPMQGKVVTAIACGSNFSLALTSDGGLYSWGSDAAYQLGNGTAGGSLLPVAVDRSGVLAGKTITAISCGASFALVLSSDGLIFGWGENAFGQLGTGGYGYFHSAVATTMSGALAGKSISALRTGVNYSLALDSGGQLYSWGHGELGKLGTNSTATNPSPAKVVSSLSAVTLVSAGGHHALAVGDFNSLPPVANSATRTAVPGQSISITLSGSDPEGDALTYSIVSGPSQGTLSGATPGTAPNSFTYTAPSNFTSADSFTFKVNDGTSDSASATVTINPGEAPSLIVTTTADVNSSSDFKTSLREAIAYANTRDGADVITFNIPNSDTRFSNGVFTINLLNALPSISGTSGGGTTIDGTSQTAFTGNTNTAGPEVALQGGSGANESLGAHGLHVAANSCVIKGLSIGGFRSAATQVAGVYLSGSAAGSTRIVGCYIGTDPTGTIARPNGFGILVMGASNVVIGDQGATGRNVISGNLSDGVRLVDCLNTAVRNCFVGTNALGTAALGNFKGIAVEGTARNNTIGGQGVGNVISGNTYFGLGIQGSGNVVQGNHIGTTASGMAVLGNASSGVALHNGAQNNTIGGTVPGTRNVISGNGEDGIYINFRTTGNNVVQGNFIGTDTEGTGAIGNRGRGIYMDAGTSGNTIGGAVSSNYPSAPSANRIAFNTGDGIRVLSDSLGASLRNNLRGNQIHSNGGLGINLSVSGDSGGVTPNDEGDNDSGANNFQNFPVLSSAVNTSQGLTVKGTLNSAASTTNARTYILDFYMSAAADPSGYGEGQIFLGSRSVTTNTSGNVAFVATFASTAPGQSITATATDAEGNTSEFSLAREVVANSAPIANDQTVSATEDSTVNITLTASDVDGDTLAYSTVSAPTSGALSGSGANRIYTPNANYNGTDTFTFRVSDGTATSNIATVTINVSGVNDTPLARDDSYSTPEDAALTIEASGVLTNDSDVDGNTLSAILEGNVQNGVLALNADGSFLYTPAPNFNGTDRFTYKANDGTVSSNLATVTINVSSANDTPVAGSNTYSTSEDTVLIVEAPGLLANDSDGDGDALSAVLVTNVEHGVLNLNANGSFLYTPAPNFNGTDRFTYRASDGTASSGTATVTITIGAVNDAPLAEGDSYSTREDTPLTIDARGVLANDSDVEGNALSALLVSDVAHGALALNADGSFSYTPTPNFSGTDRFTYKANDGTADSAVVTVTIIVSAVNDAPVAGADTYSTQEDVALTIEAPGILANDSDVDGDALSAVLASDVEHGVLNLNADGSFRYMPSPNFNGTDRFSYKASDGTGSSEAVTVTISVVGVNDAPVASGDSYSTREDVAMIIEARGVLANDSDAEENALSAILESNVQNGVLALNTDGSFSYTPAANFNGTDRFTYKVDDGMAKSDAVTVTITVGAVNDAPSFTRGANQSAAEDAGPRTVAGWATGISAGPQDEAEQAVRFELSHNNAALFSTAPAVDAAGNLSYTPAPNASGTATVSVRLRDNGGTSNGGVDTSGVQNFTITINAVNDAPVAADDAYKVAIGKTLIVPAPGVLSNDRDVDSSALSVTLRSTPTLGSVTLNADGSFTYRPRTRVMGTDRFTYQVSDGAALSNLATVSITVGGVDTTSPVTLSNGSASARHDNVVLTFTGPLDPASAVDTTRYQVQVTPSATGVPRLYTIAQLSYDSAGFNVTMSLNADLKRDDRVVVLWANLLDGRGNTLSGQSPVLVAK